MAFTVFPAIDLRHGRCVRLRQGDAGAETVYSDDPASVARRWQAEGATWLHVVNLDGALDGAAAMDSPNLSALLAILRASELPVQFGGGVRSLESAEQLLELGVARVILGTVAVTDPEVVAKAVDRFGPERVLASLDARDGLVAIRGWSAISAQRVEEIGARLRGYGLATVVHTDIARDGMLSGANIAASVQLARATGLQVIVSGGVASLDDVEAAARATREGIVGVIVGKAIYEGTFDLPSALQRAEIAQSTPGVAKC